MSLEVHHGGGGSIMVTSPSFSSYTSSGFARIAAKVSDEFMEQREELGLEAPPVDLYPVEFSPVPESDVGNGAENEGDSSDEDDDGSEFEFSFVRDTSLSPISADEIFVNGQIRTIYPVFSRDLIGGEGSSSCDGDGTIFDSTSIIRLPLRKLFIEERNGPSESTSDEFEGVADGSYCVWRPNLVNSDGGASPVKKSSSTGSQSKRWRFRDILNRSNSDGNGKETYVFLSANKYEKLKVKKKDLNIVSRDIGSSGEKIVGEKKGKGKGKISAHEMHYVRNRAEREGDKKKSYLPYRQDLVGFFANVNGISRNLHPF